MWKLFRGGDSYVETFSMMMTTLKTFSRRRQLRGNFFNDDKNFLVGKKLFIFERSVHQLGSKTLPGNFWGENYFRDFFFKIGLRVQFLWGSEN